MVQPHQLAGQRLDAVLVDAVLGGVDVGQARLLHQGAGDVDLAHEAHQDEDLAEAFPGGALAAEGLLDLLLLHETLVDEDLAHLLPDQLRDLHHEFYFDPFAIRAGRSFSDPRRRSST